MERKNILKYIPTITFICSVVGLSVFFYFTSPDTLIGYIGVENSYALIFILAFIGGLTTFSGVPYHLVFITLAVGGLNPWLLAVCTSVAVILGDSTSYFIGKKGADLLPVPIHNALQKLVSFFMKRPKALPWFFFFYAALLPFSNDFIVISMGLAKYPFWRVMMPLMIGNICFNTMLAYLSIHAYGFVQRVFL